MAQTPPSRPSVLSDFAKLTRPVLSVYEGWRTDPDPVFRTQWFGEPVHVVTDPRLVQQALTDPERFRQDFQVGDDVFETGLDPVQLLDRVGDFLNLSREETHMEDRRRVAPSLSRPSVDDHFGAMLEEIRTQTDDWRLGTVVDAQEWATTVTLRTTLRTLFGVEGALLDSLEDRFRRLLSLVEEVTHLGGPMFLPWWLPTPNKVRLLRSMQGLSEPAREIIEGRDGDDLVDRWIDAEADDEMSRSAVLNHLFTFGMAGFITTRVVVATLLHYYAGEPALARRVREEARELPTAPSPARVRELSATSRALDEVLRLHPPVHRLRRVAVEATTLGEYDLPAGATLLVPVWVLHRSPANWVDPDQFRPDRWVDRSGRQDAYLPFGRGPHACVGREFARTEAAAVLATVAREFRLTLVDQVEPTYEYHAATTMVGGNRLRVTGVDRG